MYWCQTFRPVISASFPFCKCLIKALTVSEMYVENSCWDTLVPLNVSSREHRAESECSTSESPFTSSWDERGLVEVACEKRPREEDHEEVLSPVQIIGGSENSHSWQTTEEEKICREQRSGISYLHSFLPSSTNSPKAMSNTYGAACCHWQPRLPW